MAKYKEKSAGRSGSTDKLSDVVVCHFAITRGAMRFLPPALSKPLSVIPATTGGLFLAERAKIAIAPSIR